MYGYSSYDNYFGLNQQYMMVPNSFGQATCRPNGIGSVPGINAPKENKHEIAKTTAFLAGTALTLGLLFKGKAKFSQLFKKILGKGAAPEAATKVADEVAGEVVEGTKKTGFFKGIINKLKRTKAEAPPKADAASVPNEFRNADGDSLVINDQNNNKAVKKYKLAKTDKVPKTYKRKVVADNTANNLPKVESANVNSVASGTGAGANNLLPEIPKNPEDIKAALNKMSPEELANAFKAMFPEFDGKALKVSADTNQKIGDILEQAGGGSMEAVAKQLTAGTHPNQKEVVNQLVEAIISDKGNKPVTEVPFTGKNIYVPKFPRVEKPSKAATSTSFSPETIMLSNSADQKIGEILQNNTVVGETIEETAAKLKAGNHPNQKEIEAQLADAIVPRATGSQNTLASTSANIAEDVKLPTITRPADYFKEVSELNDNEISLHAIDNMWGFITENGVKYPGKWIKNGNEWVWEHATANKI